VRQDSPALHVPAEIESNSIPPGFEITFMLSQPQFPSALRESVRVAVELYSRGRIMGWLMSDRTLLVLSLAGVCLDADTRDDDPGSGLTPGRFKAFCVQNRVCSEGRAAAVLAFMRLSGHLEATSHPADRRITLLKPSAKLREMTGSRLRGQLEVAAMIWPEVAPALERFDDPDFARPFYLESLNRFRSGMRLLSRAPTLRLFADRDVGVLILYALMLGATGADPFPARGPVSLSIAGLSRRFRVSRTHILRLIRDAEAAGLLSREGDRGELVSFSPELQEGVRDFVAAGLQHVAICAWRAIERR
jgi:hypothetical protein